jgi:hypothetical protein
MKLREYFKWAWDESKKLDESTFDKSFNGILTNMVAISRSRKELDNMSTMIDKALKKKMINSKQHMRLKMEIESLMGSVMK